MREPAVGARPSAVVHAAHNTANSTPAPAGVTWRVQVKDLSLDGGHVTFADAVARINGNAVAEPGRIELTGLRLGVQGLDWRGERRAAPHHPASSAARAFERPGVARPSMLAPSATRAGLA